jgi:hypothetical protein
MKIRFVVETILASAVAFGGTLGPLWDGGLTPAEYTAAGVAAATAALAMIRQQPKPKPAN